MKMTTLYVNTQVLENYGAHADDGRFVNENAVWKFKPGREFIVSSENLGEASLLAFINAYLEDVGDLKGCHAYKEMVSHFKEVDHDYQTDFELADSRPSRVIRIDVDYFMSYQIDNEDFLF